MSLDRARLFNLLHGIQFTDPKLFEILRQLILEQDPVKQDIIRKGGLDALEADVTPADVIIFGYHFSKRNVFLSWVNPEPGTTRFFELKQGTVWETANSILVTGSTQVVLDPLPVGVTPYLLKAINIAGTYSINATLLNVIVPAMGGIGLSAQVIDNNVLLKWNEPVSTFEISHYDISRQTVKFGEAVGTFATIFEAVSGTYTYGVTPVDIAGNKGTESTVTLEVRQPPDFELRDRLYDTLLDGDKDNLVGGTTTGVSEITHYLVGPLFPLETWTQHYTKDARNNIQDFLDDGYTIWIQPANTVGHYQKVFDFGIITTDTIVTLSWSTSPIAGTVLVSSQIEVSDDGLEYEDVVTGPSAFVKSVRYVRATYTFAPSDDKGLVRFFDHYCTISVKREVDSGDVVTDKTDVEGTLVYFNKTFRDVGSIVLTVDSIEPITAIYDFVDIPDPLFFKVLTLDSAGNRINYLVSWIARGIVR